MINLNGIRRALAHYAAFFLATVVTIFLVISFLSTNNYPGALTVSASMLSDSPSPTPTATLLPAATSVGPGGSGQGSFSIPTPQSNGVTATVPPNVSGTGWIASKEVAPHWGDPNLYAGTFQGQTYTSLVQFDVGGVMPPKSAVQFAGLELTGQNAANLGKTGEWQLELLDSNQTKDWAQASTSKILSAPTLATIGQPIAVGDLGVGQTNRFEFSAEQLKLLEQQLEFGRLTFRLKGPTANEDNLFSWESGAKGAGNPGSPKLYLVGVPGPLTVITNTPTPAGVFTAAAYVLQATKRAEQLGTPTPFGLGVITATPGGERIEVTPVGTPENGATAEAIRALATAVAITTGTYTPTPNNWFIVTQTPAPPTPFPTRTPVFIPVARMTVEPTPTRIAGPDYLTMPIPSFLSGKILAKTQRFGAEFAKLPIVFNPNGQIEGLLTGDLYYTAASDREIYAPSRQQLVYVAPGLTNEDRLQIWMQDLKTGNRTQLTYAARGDSYDPVWSPDGRSIAYVNSRSSIADIYIYDIASGMSRQLTISNDRLTYNQHPSWSPNSQQIVFKSNRESGIFQLWIINADGSGQHILNRSGTDELDPVWVKP